MQTSFGSMKMEACVGPDSALMKAHALIDWEGLRARLAGLNKCEASRMGGQEVIDPLVRNRLIALGRLAGLLAGVNSALQIHGLSVKRAQGAIIEVTLVCTAQPFVPGMTRPSSWMLQVRQNSMKTAPCRAARQ